MIVLLINPRYNGCSEIPPLGLECLAAPMIKDGVDVSILDMDILSEEEGREALHSVLRRSQPQIVGVTAMSHSFPSACQVCGIVKDLHPAALTVMGGIHATVRADEIVRNEECIDVCVRGEGETTIRELIHCHHAGQDFCGIRGASYRKGGNIFHNGDRELIRNLDELPNPAHHLVDNDKYRTRSVSSSRGCHHNCTFCSIQAQYHRTVRVRDAEKIADEFVSLAECGAKRVMFTDDNFTFSLRRVREICGLIERLGLSGKMSFYAEGRIDDICRNPIMASIMSKAGFQGIYIGAESGSAEILEYYRKGISSEDIISGVSYCIEQNLTPVLNFILFGPRDTIDTMRDTICLARLVFEMGAEIVYAETLNPYPGTPIREELVMTGLYREDQGVYYFKSYQGMDLEWVLRLCNASRSVTELLHREDKHFIQRKVYLELGYLDELLSGNVPLRFLELYDQHAAAGKGTVPADIEEVHRYIMEAVKESAI